MDTKELTPIAAIVAIAIFLVKGMFDLFKRKEEHHESKTEKLISALNENSMSIQKLTMKIEFLEKKIEMLPAIERDLSRLGAKLRDIAPRK